MSGSEGHPFVYVAGPVVERARVARMVLALSGAGFRVVSTWHERTTGQDPSDVETRRALLGDNRAELKQAELMVVLTCEGAGSATYAELGEAVAGDMIVVWSRERGGLCLYDAAPLVYEVDRDADVLAAVRDLAAQFQGGTTEG